MPNKSGVADQIISLPKGGGAIKGIGEKFQADLHTGTGNFSIPIAVPPGRNGFQPELTLGYSTGGGNGPFGLGWSLGIPGVTLKTSKGIPRYSEEDVYVLSGAEDLILVKEETVESGTPQEERHRYFRPRTEGLFARIVRVTGSGKDQWEVTSKSGVKSIYGKDGASRLNDAERPDHFFQWLLSETEDTNGNRIVYEYKREDKTGLDSEWYEPNRQYNQLYLSQIRYVNYPSGGSERYFCSVEFDYGEYDETGNATGTWSYRPDPFSTYRAGFEIRTVRRCRRILIKVHEENGPVDGQLIKSYQLQYLEDLTEQERSGEPLPANGVSLLSQVICTGHRADQEPKSFPPLTFHYSRFEPEARKYETFTAQGDYLPERALNQPDYELVDLHGYGLPDVIHTSSSGFRYWRNLGGCDFAFPRPMHERPAGVTLADQGVQFADMEGTGSADLLVTNGNLNGYYPTDFDAEWNPDSFRPYDHAPSFDLEDPDVRLFDVDGDGRIDAVRSGNPHFVVFYNRGKEGWDPEVQHVLRHRLEEFPDIYFSAPDQRVRLAAMSGDLQDIVMIHDRLIQYWPNMGYGRWGKPITMRNAPELPRNYDPKRLFFTDLDGDGYADLVYVDLGEVNYWINRGGNAYSERHTIRGTPPLSDADAVRVADMKGTGTAGILWTYNHSSRNRTNYKYLDPTGGTKPYLLNGMDNHVGATTEVSYASSTKFFLEDLANGRPWSTFLPFPVQVVEKVTVTDRLSKGKLVTCYAYHHGYWDGEEREFRGFGHVEQFDTETFESYRDPTLHGDGEELQKCFSPRTLAKTWFHVGKDVEYWHGDVETEGFCSLPSDLSPRAEREALRTLRGSVLRTELYALDGSLLETKPYTETTYRFRVEAVARNPAYDGDSDAPSHVFFPHRHESLARELERGDESRTNRTISLYDEFGNIVKEIEIGEPRSSATPSDFLTLVTDTVYAFDHPPSAYIKDRVAETVVRSISDEDLRAIQNYVGGGDEPSWKEMGNVGGKVLGRTRNYYDGEAYEGLDFRQLDHGNLVRTRSLALTQEILDTAYPTQPAGTHPEAPRSIADLKDLHYAEDTEGYWVETTRKKYDLQDPTAGSSFGLVVGLQDSNGNESEVEFDSPHRLIPVKVTDAARLSVRVEYDYQALTPRLQVDPNENETEYAFNPLGMLTAVAVKGKQVGGAWEGDTLDDPTVEYEYDLLAFGHDEKPVHFHSLQRREHKGNAFFESWEYFDGFGRSIQRKVKAEPDASDGPPRFVGSGWQIYNNKGWIVKKYEPFFTNTHEYEDAVMHGVHTTTHYDPLGRTLRTINPDGSFQQIVYGRLADESDPDSIQSSSWEAYFYDENDNGGYQYVPNGNKTDRPSRDIDALKIQDHLATPGKQIYDAWGRLIEAHEDNGFASGAKEVYITKHEYDLLGRLRRVTDAKGRPALHCVYDLLGNQLRVEQLDSGVRTSAFDAAGNLVESEDSKGAMTSTTYDTMHRPLEVKARDDGDQPPTLRAKYTYDRLTGTDDTQARLKNSLGKAVQVYDGAGKLTSEAYDFRGNLLKKTRQVLEDTVSQTSWPQTSDGDRDKRLRRDEGYVVETEYDTFNQVTSILYPDGAMVRHHFNERNLLKGITVDGKNYVKSIVYNAKGQRAQIEYGNGIVTKYSYSPQTFRLKTLLTRKDNSTALQNLEYSYDLVGNIIKVDDRARTRMENGMPYIADPRQYRYDPLYRLVSASGNERKNVNNFLSPDAPLEPTTKIDEHQPYQRRYQYDEVGNILSERSIKQSNKWTNTYSYLRGTNVLEKTSRGKSSDRTVAYRFDKCGNMTAMCTNWKYSWDYTDRMKRVENRAGAGPPSMEATYSYDSGGMRVKKVVKNGSLTKTTVYIDGLFEEYTERRGNSVKERKQSKHVMDGANRVAIIKESSAHTRPDNEPTVLYHHGDHLGSSHVASRDDGAFYNQEEYYPYGETSFGSFARKRYRFTGKERDEENGLYYHGARYYSPWLARWVNPDPAGMVDGTDRYVYARSNPIRFADLSGTAAVPANASEIRDAASATTSVKIDLTPRLTPEQQKELSIRSSAVPVLSASTGPTKPEDVIRRWDVSESPVIPYSGFLTSENQVRQAEQRIAQRQVLSDIAFSPISAIGFLAAGDDLQRQIANTRLGALVWSPIIASGAATQQRSEMAQRSRWGQDTFVRGAPTHATGLRLDPVPTPQTLALNVVPTQQIEPGTIIPRSFVLSTQSGARFWVHPNVTEHFVEYLTRTGISFTDPVRNQAMLKDFVSTVEMAVNRGVRYGETMQVGRWEITFGMEPRDQLPVIYHARPTR
jgi:RHS repeat-associated protein